MVLREDRGRGRGKEGRQLRTKENKKKDPNRCPGHFPEFLPAAGLVDLAPLFPSEESTKEEDRLESSGQQQTPIPPRNSIASEAATPTFTEAPASLCPGPLLKQGYGSPTVVPLGRGN